MKQIRKMKKKELIEFFIEQLGDNRILGKIISIEQIREKLNYIIRDVTYKEDESFFGSASWKAEASGKGTLNFNLRKIETFEEYQKIIVHELLHALSNKMNPLKSGVDEKGKYEEVNLKMGLKIAKNVRYYENGVIKVEEDRNIAINEGMTDTLAEMITGIQKESYSSEKVIYKIASIIVGEDNMLKEYFSENIPEEKSALDIFKEDLIEKYGEFLGNDINEDLKKVLALSDQLLSVEMSGSILRRERGRIAIRKRRY